MSEQVASAAIIAPTPIVLSGTATPGGTLTAAFGAPTINASGKVAFLGSMTGGTSATGIFSTAPGLLQTVARASTASPGGGGNFGSFIGAVYINAAGDVAFISALTGGSSGQGIFATSGGALGSVARLNTAAPGGGTYSTLGVPIAINPSGRVGYLAFTASGFTQGVYSGPPGATTNAVLTGQAAPSGGIFTSVTLPTINPAGHLAFGSAISNGPNIGGIHVYNGSTVQDVMLIGASAPGGGNYGNSSSSVTSMNTAGQVAFFNTLTNTPATQGIFVGGPGTVQPVARVGEAAPAGGNYSVLGTTPVVNTAGQVAFRADLTGGTSARGIFVGAPGSVQAAAIEGQPSPDGVGAFSTFSTLATSLSLNAIGQVAFPVTLTGSGVTTANDVALLAGTPGSLNIIIREGDVIDVDATASSDLRTVSAIGYGVGSGGEDGRNVTLTDNGLIAFRLTFTDGTAGIFTSAIPEPTSLGLLAAGIVPALRRRRR